ncbi:Glutathione synthetase [Pleurotus ostreatus]|nr:Glutathione synthetase [Pleurotus ostreatus]
MPVGNIERSACGAMEIVLKPQKDADRNKKAIPRFLDELPVSERKAWVAMESIVPPKGTAN